MLRLCTLLLTLALILPLPALARDLAPLGLEDAEPLPLNRTELRFGVSYLDNAPNLFQDQGSQRTLVKTPDLQLRFGLSKRVEFALDYSLQIVDEQGNDANLGSGDVLIATKIGLLPEDISLPAFSLRVATKLPTADEDKNFGSGQIDAAVELLTTRNYNRFSLYGNLGLGMIGDPEGGLDNQMRYAAGIRFPLQPNQLNLLASVEGQTLGEKINRRGVVVAGLQFQFQQITLDLGGSAGFESNSEDWGVHAGMTTRFELAGW